MTCKHSYDKFTFTINCPYCTIDALKAELEAMRKDAARFNHLQNLPVVEAQALFWMYESRKQRAHEIDLAIDLLRGKGVG